MTGQSIAQSLTGLDAEIVNANAGEMPRRSHIAAIDEGVRCVWTIHFAPGGPEALRIALGDLRYVQGDGTDLDLGVGDIDLILRLGERRSHYSHVLTSISRAAENCGARLAQPPMLVSTPSSR